MEHILLDCSAAGQETLWVLARNLWLGRDPTWPPLSFGTLLTPALDPPGSRTRRGRSRLLHIILSETALLIWTLRCERVIGHADDPAYQHSDREITARWHATIVFTAGNPRVFLT